MDGAKRRCGFLGISVVLLGACAHEQPPAAPAPAPQPVAAPTPPPKVEPSKPTEDIAAELKAATVHFDFDRDVIQFEGQEALQKLSGVLQRNPEVMIQVQ